LDEERSGDTKGGRSREESGAMRKQRVEKKTAMTAISTLEL
jgi:hypothetical protein